MRSSVIRATDRHQPTVLTSKCANFQNIGSIYERQILDERGDLNDWIAVSPAFLAELSVDRATSSRAADGIFFDRAIAPITPRQYMAQRAINEALSRGGGELSDLAFDEYLARLVQSVVGDADTYWQGQIKRTSSRRPVCESHRRDAVEAVKERLAKEYWANHSLAELASSAHCSISKLVRIFRIETGSSLHSYQQHVRIRMSLQLLKDSSGDLTEMAVQLGFASHSHFTTVFRHHFGITPSEYRREPSARLVRRYAQTLADHIAGDG